MCMSVTLGHVCMLTVVSLSGEFVYCLNKAAFDLNSSDWSSSLKSPNIISELSPDNSVHNLQYNISYKNILVFVE